MAKSLVYNAKLYKSWTYRNTNGLSDPRDDINLSPYLSQLTDGTGSGQANRMFIRQDTVLPNADKTYDLANGVTDCFGDALTFTGIKGIFLKNLSTIAGANLHIGGGPIATGGALITSIFTGGGDGGVKVYASGHFDWFSPLSGAAVTGGSADILRVYNAYSAAITYDLIVIGTA